MSEGKLPAHLPKFEAWMRRENLGHLLGKRFAFDGQMDYLSAGTQHRRKGWEAATKDFGVAEMRAALYASREALVSAIDGAWEGEGDACDHIVIKQIDAALEKARVA